MRVGAGQTFHMGLQMCPWGSTGGPQALMLLERSKLPKRLFKTIAFQTAYGCHGSILIREQLDCIWYQI